MRCSAGSRNIARIRFTPTRKFRDTLDHLLDRAKESGDVRSDLDATDVILLLGALSRMPPPSGNPGQEGPSR
ncbi:SbtR family transcriptional regulator [Jatrophihabitans lederbergiae]|uniref:SbtR family transcriptional regulator n=1 Tax=Jatrophihabitans lederbergiae TaxID=3075547 RepID=UPI0037BFB9D7